MIIINFCLINDNMMYINQNTIENITSAQFCRFPNFANNR